MILYKLEVGNGDIKYEWYGYYETFTHDDYKQNKITDHTIIKEFYDHSFVSQSRSKSLLMAANPYVPATSYFASRLQTRAIGREGKLFTEKSRRRARAKYDLNGASAKSIFDENTGQFIPGSRATLLIQHTGLKRDIEEMFMGSTLSRGRRAARRFKPGNITGFQIANQLQAIEAVTSAFDNFRLYDGTFLTHVRFVEKMMEDTNMTRAQIEKVWDKLGDKTYI